MMLPRTANADALQARAVLVAWRSRLMQGLAIGLALGISVGCSTMPGGGQPSVIAAERSAVPTPTTMPAAIAGARQVELPVSGAGRHQAGSIIAWQFEPAVSPGASATRAAVVALHGCGGLYDRQGQLSARHRMAVDRLIAQGFVVLMPDSFGPRGLREICSRGYRDRRIDIVQRRLDTLAALAHLSEREGIGRDRIALLGWSNGGTTVLAMIDATVATGAGATPAGFARAIAFYPGCGAALRERARPAVPVLLLLGAEDDWTPARLCEQWANETRGPGLPAIEVEVYAGAHHGFDGPGSTPVRRTDVPHAPDGRGVTTGGHPQARRLSWERVGDWLRPLTRP